MIQLSKNFLIFVLKFVSRSFTCLQSVKPPFPTRVHKLVFFLWFSISRSYTG